VNIELSSQAEADIVHWNRFDPSKMKKIYRLLEDVIKTPYSGLGKPEPLKYDLVGCWSRRIDYEHRLVYKVEGDTLYVASCRFHYGE
jgi:toxin YoeB